MHKVFRFPDWVPYEHQMAIDKQKEFTPYQVDGGRYSVCQRGAGWHGDYVDPYLALPMNEIMAMIRIINFSRWKVRHRDLVRDLMPEAPGPAFL